MPEAIEQIARPAITGSAVLADARHKTRPMRLAAANGQKRYEQDIPERRQCSCLPTVSNKVPA
jgi:hypothetical protein